MVVFIYNRVDFICINCPQLVGQFFCATMILTVSIFF